MNYGHYQLAKTRLVVRKNWNPLESQQGQVSAPIKDGQTIVSGMVIVLEWVSANARHEWVKADRSVAAHLLQVPHFAFQSGTDPEVLAPGLLTGLPCTNQYELQTGYYTTGDDANISSGVPLTFGQAADSNAGHVVATTRGAGPTLPIIGFVSDDHHAALVDLAGTDSSAVDTKVVIFNTHYDPRNAAS